MIKVKYILHIVIASILLSCSTETEQGLHSLEDEIEMSSSFINQNVDEIAFKGGIIHLAQEKIEDKIYQIPEIVHKRDDIFFRAKRIPTELYLLNKGVDMDELESALKEVAGEQLFYFEFEEELKQDLVKKHLEEDLDLNISYLSFQIFEDFKLVNSKGDTLISDYSLYERNFHVAPYERILVSFSGVNPNEEIKLIYNDKLFGRGKLDFAFASTAFLENNIKNPS